MSASPHSRCSGCSGIAASAACCITAAEGSASGGTIRRPVISTVCKALNHLHEKTIKSSVYVLAHSFEPLFERL